MRTANVLMLVLMILVNGLANWLPIGGQTTAEVSSRYAVWFTPPDYVFSIWALIYLLLAAFAVYQSLPGPGPATVRSRIGPLFVVSCLANAAWIVAWHYEQLVVSLVLMAALLNALAVIYVRLARPTMAGPWFVGLAFTVYLAWISVATIANASVVLYAAGWAAFGISPAVWSAIMMSVAAGIALAVNRGRPDPAFSLVLVWAFTGLAYRFSAIPVVAVPGWALSALLLGAAVIWPIARRKS